MKAGGGGCGLMDECLIRTTCSVPFQCCLDTGERTTLAQFSAACHSTPQHSTPNPTCSQAVEQVVVF